MTVEELYFALKALRAEGKGSLEVRQYMDTGDDDFEASVEEFDEEPGIIYLVGEVG
jgi:hypothetical protein